MSASILEDTLAICTIKGLYCDIIDRSARSGAEPGDRAKLLSLFKPDGVVDFSLLNGNVYTGHDEIATLYFETFPAGNEWQWHSVHSPVVEIDGDKAIGRWTLYAMVVRKAAPDALPISTWGRYIDEFERVDGVWKLKRLFFLKEKQVV
jgi:hypothetical protein